MKYDNKSEIFRYGYESFGPLLMGFTQWVNEVIKAKEIEKVFFLARDMFLVKDIYKKMFPNEDIAYLEVSRRSLREQYILQTGTIDSLFDTITRKKYTIIELLSHIGIDEDKCPWLREKYGCYLNTILNSGLNEEWYRELEKSVMYELSARDNNTCNYLKAKGLFESKKIAIVDIGWHGTIQNMLETITGHQMTGIYFGIGKRHYFREMEMAGYWYDVKNEEKALANMTMVAFIETMLFNDNGTTVSYKVTDYGINPVYGHSERVCKEDSFQIKEFQQGAIKFIEDFSAQCAEMISISRNDSVRAFETLVYRPSFHQANMFALLPYEEGKINYMARKGKLIKYIISPRKFFKDYEEAKWKTGFIKRCAPFIMRPDKIDYAIKSRRAR